MLQKHHPYVDWKRASSSCFVAAYIYLDGHGALAVVDSYSLDVDETTYVRICLVE
jgi:hypothetical protein